MGKHEPAMINMTRLLPLLVLTVAACAQQAPADLPTALKGITKAKFLACAGPPMLEYSQSGQDRMSFVTNLKRGQAIGVAEPIGLRTWIVLSRRNLRAGSIGQFELLRQS